MMLGRWSIFWKGNSKSANKKKKEHGNLQEKKTDKEMKETAKLRLRYIKCKKQKKYKPGHEIKINQ
jgi:hypothetical protein